MRKKIVAGNWKMNKTPSEAAKLMEEMKPLVANSSVDVVVCPPFVCLETVLKAVEGTNISVGAQNMYFEESGAYTGEVAPAMLTEMGVKYVILGHSERRQYFAETDETVGKKVKKALEHGLIPIVCVGESLKEREEGVTNELVSRQTKIALDGLSKEDAAKVVIAYEPIWAIGTGKTATADQAEEVCAVIRDTLKEMFGETAEEMRIQYGGSMNAGNAKELMDKPNIDGGLIGGASLKAQDFSVICSYQA